MTFSAATRLAVLGAPISHSRSPVLHAAAYAELGFDWTYDAIEVREDQLSDFVTSRGPEWRGLSLTMPLKREIVPLLTERDPMVVATGSANTVVFAPSNEDSSQRILRGYNTDVFGIVESFHNRGFAELPLVYILGGGATAASAIAAAAELGARRVVVWVRNPERAHALGDVGRAVGVDVELAPLTEVIDSEIVPSAIVSTLPQGVDTSLQFSDEVRTSSILFDVAYEPWPSPLATAWFDVHGEVIPGIDMLINQALMQIRLFAGGSASEPLPDEARVREHMRASVGR